MTALLLAMAIGAGWFAHPALAVPPTPDSVTVERLEALAERARRAKLERMRARAVLAMIEGNRKTADRLAAKTGDPLTAKLVDWADLVYHLRPDYFDRAMAFLDENGHWPRAERIRKRAEATLDNDTKPPKEVLAYFRLHPPKSAGGMLAQAKAYRLIGRKGKAAKIVRRVWREFTLNPGTEKALLKRYKAAMTKADHKERLARQIYRGNTNTALRQANRISKGHVKMAKAALSLYGGHKRGMKRYRDVPRALINEPALQFALARYWRQRNKFAQARKVLLKAQSGRPALPEPEAWWRERLDLARQGLARNNKEAWPLAYRLVKAHGFPSGWKFVQGEFLSGWIALRFLKQPKLARRHFAALSKGDDRPVNVSQAEYWLGRTHLELGDEAEAKKHFEAAATYWTTFYGQLARARLGWGSLQEQPELDFTLRHDVIARVDGDELMQAARLLKAAGRSKLTRSFVVALAEHLETREERSAVAHLGGSIGGPHLAVRVGRFANQQGTEIGRHGYPDEVPEYKALRPDVEPALIYALIRQESEFNPRAVSPAGARGLMQIMPATAKLLARRHRQVYSLSELTSRPPYNLAFGTALMHDLIKNFRGSYIMALAAYNAGPGRVIKWNKVYGDPRKGQLEPVDWIESIPFNETRNYVKRVMENLQIYRFQLRSSESVPLDEDLLRGAKKKK
ncbi:MAG: transglycosylase SLT domain-containing protein [Hyphomicrobiales bacterium]